MLSSPSKCAGQVLMTPNTEAKLKTNRDGAARMTYSVQNNNELLTVKENGLYNQDECGAAMKLAKTVLR